eukprot:gene3563-6298_t
MFQYGAVKLNSFTFRYILFPKLSKEGCLMMSFYEPQQEIFFTGEITEKSLDSKFEDFNLFFENAMSSDAKIKPAYYFSTSSVVHNSDVSHDFNSNTKSLVMVLLGRYFLIFKKEQFDSVEYQKYEWMIQNDKKQRIKPKKLIEKEMMEELKSKMDNEIEKLKMSLTEKIQMHNQMNLLQNRTQKLEDNIVQENNKKENLKYKLMFPNSTLVTKMYGKLLSVYLGKPFCGKKIYQGTIDGFTALQFHAKCNNAGPTIIIIKTTTGEIIGGYTEQSWGSGNVYRYDSESFLFSLTQRKKLKVINQSQAIYCQSGILCKFGSQDLLIANNCNSTNCTSKIGSAFEDVTGKGINSTEANHYLAKAATFKVAEIEVYQSLVAPHVLLPFSSVTCLMNTTVMKRINEWIGIPHKYSLIYSANVNGWSAANFHNHCNYCGGTITLVKCSSNQIFGGYTSVSWDSSGQYKHDPNSFLFSISRNYKLSQAQNFNSVYCSAAYGPTFGSGHVSLQKY